MATGRVFDIRHFSLQDGPGIRTTVFFKGCPMRCAGCYVPESQASIREMMVRSDLCMDCAACLAGCKPQALTWNGEKIVFNRAKCNRCGACISLCDTGARKMVGRELSAAEILAEIEKDAESGGSVTFSGGEPLQQADFLHELLSMCKARGIHTAVDTCGYASWEVFDRIRPQVDLFLYDLKLMDDARHKDYTGVSNRRVLDNLQKLSEREPTIIVRLLIIPGVNDDQHNIHQTARYIATLPHRPRVDLLAYHRTGIEKYEQLGRAIPLADLQPPSESHLEEIAQTLRSFGLTVFISGLDAVAR
ncbi:MAG: glycyl-radical enzyme activating protein [Chloroflexi bacterium]|nr:glycyl-radical enzyme activating protein [Chloroflexota bacterium]